MPTHRQALRSPKWSQVGCSTLRLSRQPGKRMWILQPRSPRLLSRHHPKWSQVGYTTLRLSRQRGRRMWILQPRNRRLPSLHLQRSISHHPRSCHTPKPPLCRNLRPHQLRLQLRPPQSTEGPQGLVVGCTMVLVRRPLLHNQTRSLQVPNLPQPVLLLAPHHSQRRTPRSLHHLLLVW